MCVFMHVVHALGPYADPHTSWDPVMGSHIFVGPDGGLAGLVGLVVGFGCGRLVSWFVGAGGLVFFLPHRASSPYRSASSGMGKRRCRATL